MAYDYDALYQSTPNALGSAAPWVVEFFDAYGGEPMRILDVGCGQGRDGLHIAALGHSVHGVDLSPAGIRDFCTAGGDKGWAVTGEVADLNTYEPSATYDLILINRTLHMLKPGVRQTLLARLVPALRLQGHVLIADEPKNMEDIRKCLFECGHNWQIDIDTKSLFIGHLA